MRFLAAAVGLSAALSLVTPDAEASALPFKIITHELDNGLRLVLVPRPGSGLIAYYSVVRVGSRDETEPGVTGFAHFFEHMMFRGTKDWSPKRVSAFLKKTGADQNGFTTDDFTCYTFFGLSGHLDELVQMEADRFQHLVYTEDVFKTESRAVLGEYNKSSSSPSLPLRERLRGEVFTRHTYGHTTLGYLKDIEAMPDKYAYSKTFFERFYTPDNTTIIAVGDFDPARLEALVERHYGGWSSRRAARKIETEPAQTAEVRSDIEWPNPTLPILSMSWRTPATNFQSKDTAVYNLLFELLFGETSPLYTGLVLDEQVVQGFSEWSWNHVDPYLFHVVARLRSAAQFTDVERAISAQIAKLRSGVVDEAQLEAVKSRVRYGLLLDLATPSRIASALAFQIGAGGDPGSLDTLLETINEVTVDDVERFARLYLNDAGRSVVKLAAKETQK